jgi:ribosome-associated protein
MRGRDPETGEFLSPSRSEQRREALEVLELAEQLMALSRAQLDLLPMETELRDMVLESQRITAPVARKRQLHYLAKMMRREEDETLEAIRSALDHSRSDARRDTAALHQIEAWRERLMAEGDAALADLLAEYPQADRQRIRQLARNATEERNKNRNLHNFRELFRELRGLMTDSPASEPGVDEEE